LILYIGIFSPLGIFNRFLTVPCFNFPVALPLAEYFSIVSPSSRLVSIGVCLVSVTSLNPGG